MRETAPTPTSPTALRALLPRTAHGSSATIDDLNCVLVDEPTAGTARTGRSRQSDSQQVAFAPETRLRAISAHGHAKRQSTQQGTPPVDGVGLDQVDESSMV